MALALLALGTAACRHGDVEQPPAGTASFTAIGTLPGDVGSEAAAVSADGRVVAGSSRSGAGLSQAFRWTSEGGIRALGHLPHGSATTATAVSANGDAIAGNADGGSPIGLHGFRWTSEDGMAQLDGLPNASLCAASAISGDGSMVAGTCLAPGNTAYRWTAATGPVGLARLGPGSNAASAASALSQDGAYVGGVGHPVLTGAVIWNASNTPLVIGTPPGNSSGAITALSRDGSVAAGVSVDGAGRLRGFRWTSSEGIVPLAIDVAFAASATSSISGDGRRIAGWASPASGGLDIAVLWHEGGTMQRVSDLLSAEARSLSSGWRLTRARAISADGRVLVGEGFDADGAARGWIVILDR